jgi:hypothetical protein
VRCCQVVERSGILEYCPKREGGIEYFLWVVMQMGMLLCIFIVDVWKSLTCKPTNMIHGTRHSPQ